MKTIGLSFLGLALAFVIPAAFGQSPRFQNAVKARLEKNYAVVIFADATRTIVPLASLSPSEHDLLAKLAEEHPLAHGKSEIKVVKDVVKLKQTIVLAAKQGDVERVQLCPPNVPRDQIGGSCMAYARVHWLDIAGYPVDLGRLYQVINAADPDQPWKNPAYHQALHDLIANCRPKPVLHRLPAQETDPFAWAREELRHGRPILAALPREIWQALPPGFVAQRPWSGGSVGHQIVVNGFTWNAKTGKGTFHVVNSWVELPEFDLSTDAASGGNLVFEVSMSPRGEVQPDSVKERVKTVTLLRAVGKTNVYEVETNVGRHKIAAPTEDAARELVEKEE